ncbi:SRPBCC family protein [Flavobacterium maritimum]|uniref:SRPBCC family protein n=1 Tax=Flavobacterium maritimum TaxID=3149042 RepID=UPI0032B39B1B
MRILKYLFLLLILSLVSLSVFVATQKGNFSVERSEVINSPRSAVYNYVNDYRNWEDFSTWINNDSEMKITYSQKTIGVGSAFSWEGKDGNGNMKTLFVKENDSIAQKMDYDGTSSDVYWTFKDTLGGTKVTWKTTGKMSFVFKIYTALNGGADKVIGRIYEKSLTNLDKRLDYEIKTYAVKVNGLVKKLETFYLKQTFTSKISDVTKNTRVVFPKIIEFCTQNNIELNGKPFVIYHTYDLVKGLTKLSFCVPIKQGIFTSEGSDILSGKLNSFVAVKTTLKGDYSHNKKALDKATEYFKTNHLVADPSFSHLEIYTIGKSEVKNPSKWTTEIYFPIKPKVIASKPRVITSKTEVIETPKIEEEVPSEF